MGDVIYLSDRMGSWDEVFSSTDANGVTIHVYRNSASKDVSISLVNAEGEAIEIPMNFVDVISMFKAIYGRK